MSLPRACWKESRQAILMLVVKVSVFNLILPGTITFFSLINKINVLLHPISDEEERPSIALTPLERLQKARLITSTAAATSMDCIRQAVEDYFSQTFNPQEVLEE